ncbi:MAG TPA: glycosyltransferase family 2 protein, partial [Dehalococcoidia bacterium]
MAVEQLPARVPRELPAPLPFQAATATPLGQRHHWEDYEKRAVRGLARLAYRSLEILPGALALALIAGLFSGYIWFPSILAAGLIVFDLYWLWKSWTIAFHVVKGMRLIRRTQATDWRAEYKAALSRRGDVLPWDGIRHVVMIPNYKESVEKLRDTLRVMAETVGARSAVIPVLAMEAADVDARAKASILVEEFSGRFADLLVTFHPHNLPGEVRGKSSNQAWAAHCAVDELVGRKGLNLDLLTITSCDADTQFPPQYFECLAYKFATDSNRYRRFWQAPIFFYNNIWQVPALLRVPNALQGMVHLSRLSRKRRVLFSQSTYSLSLRMAHDVGYWDRDVIPEDWHMFLKCFYELGGTVDVEPIFLPIGNDGALTHGLKATFVNQYLQVRRWAWGASDVAYAAKETVRHGDIALRRRLARAWYLFENHITWSTQWFFITLGGNIPWLMKLIGGHEIMPDYFTWLPRIILTPCLLGFLVIIIADIRMRPPAPAHMTRRNKAISLAHWILLPVTSFAFSALPALDSQIRLMLGRR